MLDGSKMVRLKSIARRIGNSAVASNSATSHVVGTAAGADYPVSAHRLAGFALAGGGTIFGHGRNVLPAIGKHSAPGKDACPTNSRLSAPSFVFHHC